MTDPDAKPWGLFKMPTDPKRGESTWVRNTWPLPHTWRGLIARFDTRKEAEDAWSEGMFIRELDE